MCATFAFLLQHGENLYESFFSDGGGGGLECGGGCGGGGCGGGDCGGGGNGIDGLAGLDDPAFCTGKMYFTKYQVAASGWGVSWPLFKNAAYYHHQLSLA